MMEINKRDYDPSRTLPSFLREHNKFEEVGSAFEEMKGNPLASDGFVVLDIESLSLLAAASAPSPIADTKEKNSIAGTQAPLKKTFTKKGSQRGGERRTADSIAGDKESFSVLIQVASDGDSNSKIPEKVVRNKRISARKHGTRFNPRRVVMFFATLSSMGTLILLYFTLSLGKMQADNNAR